MSKIPDGFGALHEAKTGLLQALSDPKTFVRLETALRANKKNKRYIEGHTDGYKAGIVACLRGLYGMENVYLGMLTGEKAEEVVENDNK